jgi:hypothetical protein
MKGTDQERTEIVDPRRDTEILREAFIARHDDWDHLRTRKFILISF